MNEWYSALRRPPLTPPDAVFGPVWSVLYLMIGLSIVLYVWWTRKEPAWGVYALILLHLVLNFCWTGIFFGLQRTGWALVDILLLDVTLVVLITLMWKQARWASVLLWPYALWVVFATYLNAGFYGLNRAP